MYQKIKENNQSLWNMLKMKEKGVNKKRKRRDMWPPLLVMDEF